MGAKGMSNSLLDTSVRETLSPQRPSHAIVTLTHLELSDQDFVAFGTHTLDTIFPRV